MSEQTPFLDTARRVIRAEAEALGVMADALDENFRGAIDILRNAGGRVIVTGIGKSGHIARKIAATFASTGTPAQFVHPAEASHGDLGMITSADVVLAISNSGEAPELADLVAYSRRFAIPLVGITSQPGSSLGKQCDVVLLLPRLGEACGTGIVPTTSTTMTLAMGDALAVALMENRAFTSEHFRQFHPGGKLGAQLIKVSDLMHQAEELPLVQPDSSMTEAIAEMSRGNFGMVGVNDQAGNLIGVITDGDIRRNVQDLAGRNAGDIMTSNPKTIRPDALAEEGAQTMNEKQITCLFVTNGSGPAIGLLHIHDCLRAGLG